MRTVKVIRYMPEFCCHECIDQDGRRRLLDLIVSGCLSENIDPVSIIGKTVDYDYDHPWISLAEGVRVRGEN